MTALCPCHTCTPTQRDCQPSGPWNRKSFRKSVILSFWYCQKIQTFLTMCSLVILVFKLVLKWFVYYWLKVYLKIKCFIYFEMKWYEYESLHMNDAQLTLSSLNTSVRICNRYDLSCSSVTQMSSLNHEDRDIYVTATVRKLLLNKSFGQLTFTNIHIIHKIYNVTYNGFYFTNVLHSIWRCF